MRTLAIAALVMAAVASQAQIYDNGAPNQANGNEMTEWNQAEDFTLGSTQTIGAVRFWDIESTGGVPDDGQVAWAFYADSGGPTGTALASGTTAEGKVGTGVTVLGAYNEFVFNFAVNFTATANTTYWLALHLNPTEGYATRDNRYWETTNANGTSSGVENFQNAGAWTSNGTEHAFQLYGPTPEPASMVALGLGVVALIRRRRSAK